MLNFKIQEYICVPFVTFKMQTTTMYLWIHTSTVTFLRNTWKKNQNLQQSPSKGGLVLRAGGQGGMQVCQQRFLMLHSKYKDTHSYLSFVWWNNSIFKSMWQKSWITAAWSHMCEKADVKAHIEPSREAPPGINSERDAKKTLTAKKRPQPLHLCLQIAGLTPTDSQA